MRTIGKFTGLTLILIIWAGFTMAGNFAVDNSKSTVTWIGRKFTGEHTGTIKIQSGSLDVRHKAITGGNITIDMNSITDEDLKDAGMNSKLIGHLKSDDFFAVARFPVSKLELTDVKKLAGNNVEFSGNLTIKGITNPVTFKANTVIEGKILTAVGDMVINRAKFDVRYGSGSFFGGLGDKIIYDDFTLSFKLVATEK